MKSDRLLDGKEDTKNLRTGIGHIPQLLPLVASNGSHITNGSINTKQYKRCGGARMHHPIDVAAAADNINVPIYPEYPCQNNSHCGHRTVAVFPPPLRPDCPYTLKMSS